MIRQTATVLTICLALSCLAGPAPAAAPPSAQSAAVRAQVQGVEQGRATFVTIGDPAKAEAIGLPGLAAGQKVKVDKTGEGAWKVTDPATGRSVDLDKAPDLGK